MAFLCTMRPYLGILGLALAACTTSEQGGSTEPDHMPPVATTSNVLHGTRWELVELQGAAIAKGTDRPTPHIQFNEADSSVAGNTGCNGFGGPYHTTATGGLSFGELHSTLMACPDMEHETALYAALPTVDGFAVSNDTLVFNQGTQEIARWRKAE